MSLGRCFRNQAIPTAIAPSQRNPGKQCRSALRINLEGERERWASSWGALPVALSMGTEEGFT